MATILIVEDEEKLRRILKIILMQENYNIIESSNGLEAIAKLRENDVDIVISDIKMPEMDGFELLQHIKEENIPVPVIFITAFATIESAVNAMRMGVIDYIQKPFEEEKILITVEKALGISRILQEKNELKKELDELKLPVELIFESQKMREVIFMLKKAVSLNRTTYLITGESGVGKEVIARFIHKISIRKNEKFIPINCNAIPKDLVESELFGYEKGAFTGAIKSKKGAFELADKGTLFLDEIGDLPFDIQGKLLRVLQEQKFYRVGGSSEIKVDVQIIAATNKELEKLIKKGHFREDLYYRLNVIPVHIPSLRDRREDILPLAKHFLKELTGVEVKEFLTENAKKIVESYNYPGNIRELKNTIERAWILSGGKVPINSDNLRFLKFSNLDQKFDDNITLPNSGINLEELEKQLIKQALDKTGGNKSAAARLLGLTRAKLRTRVKMLEGK
jgi:DNA-binding NtrC family response regulator